MKNRIRNAVALLIAFVLLGVPAFIIRATYEILFVGASPAIEQLRSDMNRIESPISEDVIGQATKWNQKIRIMQAYNKRWWGDPFIPDSWNSVPLLPIPKKTGHWVS